MSQDIRHDEDRGLFYVESDGSRAYLKYARVDDKTLNYLTTFVPSPLRGKGLAGKIVNTALEYARENNYQIIPTCDFVESYVEKHPEFQNLVKS